MVVELLDVSLTEALVLRLDTPEPRHWNRGHKDEDEEASQAVTKDSFLLQHGESPLTAARFSILAGVFGSLL